jgi:hypothetical protein
VKQIRIYNHVFRIEKTIYSIQGIPLPIPVSYRQMVFFVGTAIAMILLNRFPPICWIEYHLIKFIGIPFLVAWFFTRKTLDGKSPHRFILRFMEYTLSPHLFARYKPVNQGMCKYEGEVAYRSSQGGDVSGPFSVSSKIF